MLTILQTPPALAFCGNPSQFKVISDNYLTSSGTKCSFNLRVSAGDPSAGHVLNFQFSDITIEFNTATTPDDSGLQIQTETTTSHFAIFSQKIYIALLSNYEFTSRFKVILLAVQPTYRDIYVEALETGNESNVVISTNIVTISIVSQVIGVSRLLRDGFSVIGCLFDFQHNKLAQDNKPVDADGVVNFDFSEYLTILSENVAGPRFTYPFDPSVCVHTFANYIFNFYGVFAENYSGIIRKLHFSDLLSTMQGGLNRETLVYYNLNNIDFFTQPGNIKSFMTWAPIDKTTGITTPEKLFFFVGRDPAFNMCTMVSIIHFTDGTSIDGPGQEFGISAGDVIELSVGYSQLDLGSVDPTRIVYYWEIYIYVDGALGEISERRIFRLDPVQYDNERVFMFENSFGRAYDVIRFTGIGSTEIKIESSQSNSVTIDPASSFNAPSRRFDVTEGQLMVTNSGWVTKEIKDWLREMLLSKQVYEYKDDLLYPIIITNESIKEHLIDDQFLYSLDLQYQRAYRDFFFSKLPVVLPVLGRDYCSSYGPAYS